jgi:hypothetical protein
MGNAGRRLHLQTMAPSEDMRLLTPCCLCVDTVLCASCDRLFEILAFAQLVTLFVVVENVGLKVLDVSQLRE